jgi:hypothetical protein
VFRQQGTEVPVWRQVRKGVSSATTGRYRSLIGGHIGACARHANVGGASRTKNIYVESMVIGIDLICISIYVALLPGRGGRPKNPDSRSLASNDGRQRNHHRMEKNRGRQCWRARSEKATPSGVERMPSLREVVVVVHACQKDKFTKS